MRLLPVGVERPLDVPVERPHDADPGEHHRAAKFRDQEQRFHCGLPFWGVVLAFGSSVT
jgi:hypothetical protein